jgi:hypothetical protein
MLKISTFFEKPLLLRLTSGIILDNGSSDRNKIFATIPLF